MTGPHRWPSSVRGAGWRAAARLWMAPLLLAAVSAALLVSGWRLLAPTEHFLVPASIESSRAAVRRAPEQSRALQHFVFTMPRADGPRTWAELRSERWLALPEELMLETIRCRRGRNATPPRWQDVADKPPPAPGSEVKVWLAPGVCDKP